jgi:hypothetical protein
MNKERKWGCSLEYSWCILSFHCNCGQSGPQSTRKRREKEVKEKGEERGSQGGLTQAGDTRPIFQITLNSLPSLHFYFVDLNVIQLNYFTLVFPPSF